MRMQLEALNKELFELACEVKNLYYTSGNLREDCQDKFYELVKLHDDIADVIRKKPKKQK